jgi:limonene-1,2-epoxide hydrolase
MRDIRDLASLTRRDILVGAGGLAASSLVGCTTQAQIKEQAVSSELEQENERIVTQFCLDWAKRDVDLLADYLADDIVYQMFEGRPDILGKEAFKQALGGFTKNLKSIEWEILRTHTIGELVINDRIDHFIGETEEKSMHFAIAGFFLVKEGKIKVWKDYSLPGGISQVGGAFTGG